MSGAACDIRRPSGRLYSESRDGSGRLGGTDVATTGKGTSSCIILIDGTGSPPLAVPAPSDGKRISIVYTESWLTERDPRRLLFGRERESRGPELEEISCNCESGCKVGRIGVGETFGSIELDWRPTAPLPEEYGSRITFIEVHLKTLREKEKGMLSS